MYSKLSVLRFKRLTQSVVRHLGGLTPLEKYERLRRLCCTSDLAKRVAELESEITPRHTESNDSAAPPCTKPEEQLNIRCKTAMVVGGGSGIGYETAHKLLKEGVLRVIVADHSQCAGTEAVKKLCSTYGNNRAFFLMTDLTEQPSVEMAFKELYRYFNQLDIYVNCVGIYNETPNCWEKMVRTNLLGCVRGTLLAYKYLKQNPPDSCGQGTVIVNVSSYGSVANVPSMPLYSAASNGINGLTTSFGQPFHFKKSKVRFVTVCPSCTDSGELKNLDKNHYEKQWVAHSTSAMKCCAKQSAKIVGQAIVNAVRFGANGGIYVVKEGKYYRYAMPDYVKIMRQETVLL